MCRKVLFTPCRYTVQSSHDCPLKFGGMEQAKRAPGFIHYRNMFPANMNCLCFSMFRGWPARAVCAIAATMFRAFALPRSMAVSTFYHLYVCHTPRCFFTLLFDSQAYFYTIHM